MKRSETVNTFTDGLVMDLNPLTTPNNVITNALNATFITYNGNEYVLLNDMGNGRVETAYLPLGYVPLGVTELGGIIYVVSYNPLIDKCLIGSFPSPERNITSDEIADLPDVVVTNSNFLDNLTSGNLKTYLLKVSLLDSDSLEGITLLNPGDKYAIYCTNNGVSGNKEFISDVGNSLDLLQVDTVPRTVTIHVVSIGDDGKITYLDDSLKWTELNGGGYYYIKETSNSLLQQTDIDEYRSLVSTAYNTFASKVSGLLALLFELKVIDSFALTWDAEVENTENEDSDRKATIKFEMNWTSSHSTINPKYAILELSDYSDSLATLNGSTQVSAGSFYTFLDDDTRVNDGSDENIVASVGEFNYDSDSKLLDYIWQYTVVPAMKFGKLPYLAKSGSINFLDIGSGKTDLTEWRYYILETNFYMNCGFDIYPEKNKHVELISFYFIPFYKIGQYASQFEESTELDFLEATTDIPKYLITDRTSYAGTYQELINFGEYSRIKNGIIEKNMLYLVDIVIQYGPSITRATSWEYRHHYRWLYTTGLWNEIYREGDLLDFNELTLDDVLRYDQEWDINDNISYLIDSDYSNVSRPFTSSEDPTYDMFGSLVTTVNCKLTEDENLLFTVKLNKEAKSFEVGVTPSISSYPELFLYKLLDSDTYNFNITQTNITYDDLNVILDIVSSLLELVKPFAKEPNEATKCIELNPNLSDIIKGVLDDGINSREELNSAEDLLLATITTDNTNKFSVNVCGALFSKIAASLIDLSVTVKLSLRPFILYETDLNLYDFKTTASTNSVDVDVYEYIKEEHKDLNKGGDGFTFYFTSMVNDTGMSTTDKDDFKNEANNKLSYWWSNDRAFYTQLLEMTNRKANSFKLFYTAGDGKNRTMYTNNFNEDYNGNNLHDYYYVWVRTDNDHIVPINCFSKGLSGRKKIAKALLGIYSSLYYVLTELLDMVIPTVSNIVYVTNYRVLYNVVISTQINMLGSSIDEHVTLHYVNEDLTLEFTMSLKELLDILVDKLEIVLTNNINTDKEVEISDRTLTHTFSLINESLYSTFVQGKDTIIPGFSYNSFDNKITVYLSAKDPNYVYVYNTDTKQFQKVSSAAGKYIYGDVKTYTIEDSRVIFNYNGCRTIGNEELYDYIQYKDGKLVFLENNILATTYSLYFHTGAKGKGNAGLMVYGNSDLYLSESMFKLPYRQ